MIQEESNYYPFGLKHEGYNSSSLLTEFGTSYKYKFLGQELQENGFYDLGARFYVPELGIFGQHDPLSGKTLDPYGYAYQNPVFFSDPTGLEGDPVPGSSGTGNPQAIGTTTSPIDVGEVVITVKSSAIDKILTAPSIHSFAYGIGLTSKMPPLKKQDVDPRFANCSQCNDGPLRYIGGAGDPTGIWEILGIVLSSSEDSNLRLAALPLLVMTRNTDDALKLVAVEKEIVKKAYSKSRPSYGKGQVDEVWEAAKQKNGKVYDPNTGEELIWDKAVKPRSWDMGHLPGHEYRTLHQKYMSGKITKEEFLKEYRTSKNYQPESKSANRSHKYEQK